MWVMEKFKNQNSTEETSCLSAALSPGALSHSSLRSGELPREGPLPPRQDRNSTRHGSGRQTLLAGSRSFSPAPHRPPGAAGGAQQGPAAEPLRCSPPRSDRPGPERHLSRGREGWGCSGKYMCVYPGACLCIYSVILSIQSYTIYSVYRYARDKYIRTPHTHIYIHTYHV